MMLRGGTERRGTDLSDLVAFTFGEAADGGVDGALKSRQGELGVGVV